MFDAARNSWLTARIRAHRSIRYLPWCASFDAGVAIAVDGFERFAALDVLGAYFNEWNGMPPPCDAQDYKRSALKLRSWIVDNGELALRLKCGNIEHVARPMLSNAVVFTESDLKLGGVDTWTTLPYAEIVRLFLNNQKSAVRQVFAEMRSGGVLPIPVRGGGDQTRDGFEVYGFLRHVVADIRARQRAAQAGSQGG